jgi:hypothetical protein
MSNSRTIKSKESCPRCVEADLTGYNTLDFLEKYKSSTTKLETIKQSDIYHCTDCNSYWIVNEKDYWIRPFEESKLNFIREWGKKDISIPPQMLAVLEGIGADIPDAYGNNTEIIQIPCRCTLKSGKKWDYCILQIQRYPDLDTDQNGKKVIYIDEVVEIQKSDYALSYDVRANAANAFEVRMSYTPSWIKSPDGKIHTLNGIHHFFYYLEYKGKDFVVSDPPVWEDQEGPPQKGTGWRKKYKEWEKEQELKREKEQEDYEEVAERTQEFAPKDELGLTILADWKEEYLYLRNRPKNTE